MLREQVAQPGGARKFFDDVGPQLNAGEFERGNVINCLPVASVPGDRCIAEMNLTRRRRNRRVEVGQVDRWIDKLRRAEPLQGKGNCGRRSRYRPYSQKKLTARYPMLHISIPYMLGFQKSFVRVWGRSLNLPTSRPFRSELRLVLFGRSFLPRI